MSRGWNHWEALVHHRAGRGPELSVFIILQHQHTHSMPAPFLSSQAIRTSLREARKTFSGHFPAFGILPGESTGEELRKGSSEERKFPPAVRRELIFWNTLQPPPPSGPKAVQKLRTLQGGGWLLHLLSTEYYSPCPKFKLVSTSDTTYLLPLGQSTELPMVSLGTHTSEHSPVTYCVPDLCQPQEMSLRKLSVLKTLPLGR